MNPTLTVCAYASPSHASTVVTIVTPAAIAFIVLVIEPSFATSSAPLWHESRDASAGLARRPIARIDGARRVLLGLARPELQHVRNRDGTPTAPGTSLPWPRKPSRADSLGGELWVNHGLSVKRRAAGPRCPLLY